MVPQKRKWIWWTFAFLIAGISGLGTRADLSAQIPQPLSQNRSTEPIRSEPINSLPISTQPTSPSMSDLLLRLDQLEATNQALISEVNRMKVQRTAQADVKPVQVPPMPGEKPNLDPNPATPTPSSPAPITYQPTSVDCVIPKDEKKYPTIPLLTGFFQMDSVWFDQSPNNRATVGDVQDGIDFRRARLAAKGNVTKNTSYIMEFDFAASQARFVDVWMNFASVPVLGNIRVGRWRQPFGMSALTSVRELPFLERATPFAFVPFRQSGIGAYNTAFDDNLTWAISAYRYPSTGFGNTIGDNGGWGMAGRVTALPYYANDGEQLIHVGVDYSFNDPANDLLRFQNQPEIFVGENAGNPILPGTPPSTPPFVDTGAVRTKNQSLWGLEGAAAYGPLYFQSEAYWSTVNLLNGGSNTYPGAYAQARWILTGERLPYNKKGGIFGRVVPNQNVSFATGGIGAWELAARYSYIDLNGVNQPGPGRLLNDLTIGLSWYINGYTKMQFNYIRPWLTDPTLGRSTANIFALRSQIDF